jgi:hypothetical protein
VDILSETLLWEIPYYTTLENRRAKRGGGSTEVVGETVKKYVQR